jgi:flagellar biosynthesis/type III secretory pathway ATPase
MMPKIRAFLRQSPNDQAHFDDTVSQLSRLSMEAETELIRAERTAA